MKIPQSHVQKDHEHNAGKTAGISGLRAVDRKEALGTHWHISKPSNLEDFLCVAINLAT